jgi:hypothetical protein
MFKFLSSASTSTDTFPLASASEYDASTSRSDAEETIATAEVAEANASAEIAEVPTIEVPVVETVTSKKKSRRAAKKNATVSEAISEFIANPAANEVPAAVLETTVADTGNAILNVPSAAPTVTISEYASDTRSAILAISATPARSTRAPSADKSALFALLLRPNGATIKELMDAGCRQSAISLLRQAAKAGYATDILKGEGFNRYVATPKA